MYTKPAIKVCGMRDANNIQQLTQLPIDYIGFIFYPNSQRYVGNTLSVDTVQLIPSRIRKVGVFVNEDINKLISLVKMYNLDYAQLHGNESIEYCTEINNNNIRIIKAFGIHESFDFATLAPYSNICDYFLFDTKTSQYGGSGIQFDWEILKLYNGSKQYFLSGGIGPDDKQIITTLPGRYIHALNLNSKFELSPGVKDIITIQKFIDQ